MEDVDWKYDRWPEFFNGRNVADFYDPDIEEKLKKLEEEEDKILQMELNEAEMEGEEEDDYSDGITEDDLQKALKEVRGKKTILKMKHKEKKNLRARSKIKKLADMEEHLESKGINFNKETLKQRAKSRRRIGDLESAQDKKSKRMLDSDDDMDVDVNTINEGGDRRGRKRQRSMSDDDDYMEVDQVNGRDASAPKSSKGTTARSMTPAQLKVRAQSKLRSLTKGRREGSVPQRHPTRMVTEESIRLAKKINKRMFAHKMNVNEADRVVNTKKPKHLFAGKRGNGKNERR